MPDPKQQANQPFADAMKRARLLAGLTLDEWATRLSEHGVPATRNQAWKWESGETIVPAYALDGARRAIGRGMAELMATEGDPLADRVGELEARIEALKADLRLIHVTLRRWGADAGLPDMPELS